MRKFIIFTLVFICVKFCAGQTDAAVFDTNDDSESFLKLKEGVIKKEIAFFYNTVAFSNQPATFPTQKVNKVSTVKCTDTSALFSSKDLSVEITAARFDTALHKLTYANKKRTFLLKIDGNPIWGTDGNIPRKKISRVAVTVGEHVFNLPANALEGLYEPNFCYGSRNETETAYCRVFISTDKQRIYIYMENSDGAGGYEVVWVIQHGHYLKRILDYGF